MGGTSYETMEGSNVVIGCDGESLTVNGIKMVLRKDIVTTNGVIHLIDQVLMPDSGWTLINLETYKFIFMKSSFQCFVLFFGIFSTILAKQVMELMGDSQSTFREMVAQLGLSSAMKPKADYTLLAPLNTAFSGRSDHCIMQVSHFPTSWTLVMAALLLWIYEITL